ncbi:unnamed protein product [Lampetra fluviatilis]
MVGVGTDGGRKGLVGGFGMGGTENLAVRTSGPAQGRSERGGGRLGPRARPSEHGGGSAAAAVLFSQPMRRTRSAQRGSFQRGNCWRRGPGKLHGLRRLTRPTRRAVSLGAPGRSADGGLTPGGERPRRASRAGPWRLRPREAVAGTAVFSPGAACVEFDK